MKCGNKVKVAEKEYKKIYMGNNGDGSIGT